MPRRSTLTLAGRESLFAVPTDEAELIRRYAFSEQELSVIQQHRGYHNRLGFAVQLCYMRYPGYILPPTDDPAPTLLKFAANQTGINAGEWDNYARREQTRREHLVELQTSFGFQPFTVSHYRHAVRGLDEVASQTDKGIVLAQTLVEDLRRKKVLFPSVNVIERACAEAVTRATRRIHRILTESLTSEHRAQLDSLLEQFNGSKMTTVMWLRQSPGVPNAKHLLEHIQRLKAIQLLRLPEGAERQIHQNRLLKLAREGGHMTAQHLRDFEPTRRHATLMAVLLEARATIIDEIVDLHDRMIGVLFNRAKRAHAEQFQQSGKAINEKVRLYWRVGKALLEAKASGSDPFAAIESIISWDAFAQTVTEAQSLAQAEDFDYLHRISDGYTQVRRYAPAFLQALELKAAPAAKDILDAVETLKTLNAENGRTVLLTAILADAINLGLAKMAESCPGTTYARLSWLQAWHIREETYSAALAELVNAQFQQPFSIYWGEGTTSSSDGQRFRAGGKGEATGQINPKYGSDPGVLFYTHISDQYAPFHTQVINTTVRDATYVLDGLLYHESDLRIEEHYTDTAGFTDHVFALMHLLGYRFAPRIRDLSDRRLYVPNSPKSYPALSGLIGGALNQKLIRSHWEQTLRVATSIKQGTVTASLMLRKLGAYPRQNGLAIALRELGRIERTLFTLDWLQSVEFRRRVQVGLNKGEAKNALARAVFFNRLGEIRDRSFENQRYRASGLNLVVAAIVLWNTTYLERAVQSLKAHGHSIHESLLQHLSPMGWEHINLTGDYVWPASKRLQKAKFRSLRSYPMA